MKIYKYLRVDGWHIDEVYIVEHSKEAADERLKLHVEDDFDEYVCKRIFDVGELKPGIM